MDKSLGQHLTFRFELPRQFQRFRELLIYVAKRCQDAEYFGAIKLNKILYHSDFESFRRFGVPITGVPYFRLPKGPAPQAMIPIRRELMSEGAIRIEERPQGPFTEERVIPLREPILDFFTNDEIEVVDNVIDSLWDQTATEASTASHDIRWRTLQHKDRVPYEAVFLSNEPLSEKELARTRQLAERFGWDGF